MAPSPHFILGEWTVSTDDGVLRRGSTVRRLGPKPLEVLLLLIARPGEVLSPKEILRCAWPDINVGEGSVARCIFQIREALEDDRERPRYIETIPKRGYRLLEAPRDEPRREIDRPLGIPLRPWLGLAALLALTVPWALKTGPVPAPPSAVVRSTDASTDGAAELARALGYYRRFHPQDNENALGLFQGSLRRNPSLARARAGLADAYVQRARRYGHDPVWIEQGLREAELAVSQDAELPEAHKARALALAAAGRLREAVAANRVALALRPSYAEAWANLGRVLSQMGRWAEALRCFERRVSLERQSADAAADMGGLLAELGRRGDARSWLERALAIEPAGTEANLEMAWLEVEAGAMEGAARRLERLVAIDPQCARCWSALATCQRRLGREAQSLASLESGLRLGGATSGTDMLRFRLAVIVAPSNAPRARDLLLEIERSARAELAAGSERWRPRYMLAATAARRGRPHEALSWLERAVDHGYRYGADGLLDPVFAGYAGLAHTGRLVEEMRRLVEDERRRVGARTPAFGFAASTAQPTAGPIG